MNSRRLTHLERLMRIFNTAHERDPSIPQLVPIATRRIFSPNRRRAPEGTPEKAPGGSAGPG